MGNGKRAALRQGRRPPYRYTARNTESVVGKVARCRSSGGHNLRRVFLVFKPCQYGAPFASAWRTRLDHHAGGRSSGTYFTRTTFCYRRDRAECSRVSEKHVPKIRAAPIVIFPWAGPALADLILEFDGQSSRTISCGKAGRQSNRKFHLKSLMFLGPSAL